MSEITNRIDALLDKYSLKRVDIVKATGIGESTIRGWYADRNPTAETLSKVADFFGVSTDFLLGKERKNSLVVAETTPQYLTYSTEEKDLIQNFRQLSEKEKKALFNLSKDLM